MQPQPEGRPSKQEVLSHLIDIESFALTDQPGFKGNKLTPQQLKILHYIVGKELAGEGESIKAWSIGVEGLGRKPSFEPKEDGTVAVQVGRIRERLKEYYGRPERWRDRIRIEIPKGGYRPVLSCINSQEQLDAAAAAALRSAQVAADRLTLAGFAAALKYLDDILLKYPEHPLVLAIKADIHATRAIHGMPPKQELETAEKLAKRALELSPNLPEALIAYGYVLAVFGRWREAREAFAGVHGVFHPAYIAFLVSQGESGTAVRLVKEEVDKPGGYYRIAGPSSPIMRSELAFQQILAGELEGAKITLASALNDNLDLYILHVHLAMLREALGDPRGAANVMCKAPVKWSESAVSWGLKGLFLGLSGARWRAQIELVKLRIAGRLGFYVPASQYAVASLGAGKHQDAVIWLRRMAEDRDPLVLWLGHFPFFRHLAHLPEFHALLDELGLEWRWKRQDTN